MIATEILGPEHDVAIRDALLAVLREMDAKEGSHRWGVVGSQEIGTAHFTLGEHSLTVEAETYIGLSITGDQATVGAIAVRVRGIMSR